MSITVKENHATDGIDILLSLSRLGVMPRVEGPVVDTALRLLAERLAETLYKEFMESYDRSEMLRLAKAEASKLVAQRFLTVFALEESKKR